MVAVAVNRTIIRRSRENGTTNKSVTRKVEGGRLVLFLLPVATKARK